MTPKRHSTTPGGEDCWTFLVHASREAGGFHGGMLPACRGEGGTAGLQLRVRFVPAAMVCDMAHWQLSPGERAQRRARWRCSKGNHPFPYGREVRPCYPLIPVYMWC
jgi:hypothetical protein